MVPPLRVSPFLLALAWALPVLADTEVKRLDPIVVVAPHYQNAVGSSDAASQGGVTADLIAQRPTLRPGELLEFVPGVIVTQHSGDGKANQYFLRGFNLDHGTDFATTVDGIPVNMRTNAHGQGYTDLNFLIPELVRRIDYKKGPYYAEEGDFASAGSAHLALFDTLPEGLISATLGEHEYLRGVVAKSFPLAGGNLLYGLELAHNNGPWDQPERLHRVSGVLRYSAGTATEGYHLTAMLYEADWHATDQIPQRAVDAGLIGRFGALDPTDGGGTARQSLAFDWHKRDADGVWAANVYAVHSRLDLYSNFTYFLDDPVRGDQFEQSEHRLMLGANLSKTWLGEIAGMSTDTTLGLQTRADRLSPVGLYHTVARSWAGTTREDRVSERSAGVFASNTTAWFPWLRTVAGLRVDQYHFDVASNLPENSGVVGAHIVSPKLSAIFGPWAKTEFFLNYGEGFHSNDARGVTETLTPKERLPTNPVTPLAKTRGEELGLRTEIVPGLQSSLALWRLKIASELVFSGDAGDTEASRPSRRQGIEWNNHYVAGRHWLIDADFSASHTRFTTPDPVGDFVPGSVDKVVSFGVSMQDFGPWSGQFQVRYFGPRPLIEDNSLRSSATTLASLRVGYALRRDLHLQVDVFNLFNSKASDIDYAYASRLAGEAAEGVNDVHFHPVEPRTVRVTVKAGF